MSTADHASSAVERWLWAALGAGLLLRVCLMLFYTPTVFNYYGGDVARYMRLDFVGIHGIFGDNEMTAGYPAFLAALRAVWAWLPLTTATQHLLGLGSAALLYACVVRAGAPRWAALVPAAVVALSGDVLFLEHSILTEALWMPAVLLGIGLVACAITAERPAWWLAGGGTALAGAVLVRNTSLGLVLLAAVWAALCLPGGLRARLAHGLAVLLPALAVIGSYIAVSGPLAGGYSGISENRGVILYGRVAQFADCTRFTPDPRARSLCTSVPPDARPGPLYWKWGAESPLRAEFQLDGFDREQQGVLYGFAREAIVHQPLDYLRAAAKDGARFVSPNIGSARPFGGADPSRMSFGSSTPYAQAASQEELAAQMEEAYGGVGTGRASGLARTLFGAYQATFRVNGALLLILAVLGIVGSAIGSRQIRAGASLFLLAGLLLLLVPALLWSYDARFAVLPATLFAASAAFGLAALGQRFGAERS